MTDKKHDKGSTDDGEGDSGTGIVTKTRPKTKKPSLYKVLLLNDDYTPMEFVVLILERFFNKTRDEAVEVARDGGEALVERRLCGVDENDLDAASCRRLGNPAAHRAGADDPDCAD